jgi:phage shock protein PspC (stress-responsive transcriptional regulator)
MQYSETNPLNSSFNNPRLRFVRSKDGWVAGVCKGLANTFDLSPGLVRIIFLIATLWFGVSIGIYLVFAISLPREDKLNKAYESKVLGVCARISQRFSFEVGLVRFLAILAALTSFGFFILAYIVLYFAMEPVESERK